MIGTRDAPARLSPGEFLRLGLIGIRARRIRAALSALGICIGIATMFVVTGIPASSQRHLLDQLTALGTNLLQAVPEPGQTPPLVFPSTAQAMARRIGPVTAVTALANTQQTVGRTDMSNPSSSVGLTVLATDPVLLSTVNATMHAGHFLSASTDAFPTVVLGYQAATVLGFDSLPPGQPLPQVDIDHRYFTVIGILDPTPLATDIEQSVLVGWPAAQRYLRFDGHPTEIYLKAREDALPAVRSVLPATLDPESPDLVRISRPSDALAAKQDTESAYSGLFLGLAGIALVIGGIGVANTMVISVLERRSEIGLRRALGASRGHIRGQFLTEAIVLSCLGGLAGMAVGGLAVLGYATWQGWPPVIPPTAIIGSVAGTLLIGMLAGLYPAVRAAGLAPTTALAAP